MGMAKKIIFIFCSFLLGYLNVHALDPACTVVEQNRLKTLASQVYFSYELKTSSLFGGGTYKYYEVTASGIIADFYIYNQAKGLYFASSDGKLAIAVTSPGQSIELPFYASNSGVCNGFKITTKFIKLPAYNVFSENPLCVGNEEYVLCNPSSSIVIKDVDAFEASVREYIDSKNNQNNENEEEEHKPTATTVGELVFNFLSDYYPYISGVLGGGSLIGIFIMKSKERKELI